MNSEAEQYYESKQSYNIRLKFGGDNEISLNALGTSLLSINTLIDEAASPECTIKINVKSITPGSFVIDLATIATAAAPLLNYDNINYIKQALSTVKEWIDIKKFLNGNKPKKIETDDSGKQCITNNEGEVKMISNAGAKYFENCNIKCNIIQLFTGSSEANRTNLILSGEEGEEYINVGREDFYNLKTDFEEPPTTNRYITYSTTQLLIRKPDFIGNSKWEFYMNKNIEAKIEDEEWLKKFRNDKAKICCGTQLSVKIRMETMKDDCGNPIENTTRYYIEKVFSIVPPMEQMSV